MNGIRRIALVWIILWIVVLVPKLVSCVSMYEPMSPECMVISTSGETIYIAEKTACSIAVFDVKNESIRSRIPLPSQPTGLSLSEDSKTLFVTCSGEWDLLGTIDTLKESLIDTVPVGQGACSPVLDKNGTRLFVCNQFENSLSVIDLLQKKEISRIPTGREPNSSILTTDGEYLFIANHLPQERADQDTVAAKIQVIRTNDLQWINDIPLPTGSTLLKQLCLSSDGRYVIASHLLAHFQFPTTQSERGWIGNNAFTIIRVDELAYWTTVLLDDIDRGAANPWGMTFSSDGQIFCITHSGTDELSLIRFPELLQKIEDRQRDVHSQDSEKNHTVKTVIQDEISTDLHFLSGIRQRIRLAGKGARHVQIADSKAFVSNYFSDDLNIVDLRETSSHSVTRVSLSPTSPSDSERLSLERRGEMLFHDANIGFQGWQSCSSCHPEGRSDGLNWDLLNDGVGNPKNTKSLLYSMQTPPSMSEGVRATADYAVRSGLRHILYAERSEEDTQSLNAYLQSMLPSPNPVRNNQSMHDKITRGMLLFYDKKIGCIQCHYGFYYTDLRSYNVGTRNQLDRTDIFDNPTLRELWRTAPYLHDGRAATLREIFSTWNPADRHGHTSPLTEEQLADLEAFLLSL